MSWLLFREAPLSCKQFICHTKQYICHRNILLVTFGAGRKSNWQLKIIKVFIHRMNHFHEKMTHLWKRDICKFYNNNKHHTILIFHEEVFLHLFVFICFNHFKIMNTGQVQKIVYSVGVVFKMHLIIYWWWVNIFWGISNKVLQSFRLSLQWARPKKVLFNKCSHFWIIAQHQFSVI